MSTFIRISYEKPEELAAVILPLKPWIKKEKLSTTRVGEKEYRKAYLELTVPEKSVATSCETATPGL